MRTYVYIDGFNLYYGALKGTKFKWLDPKALVARLLPDNYHIETIRYFTARVSGIPDPESPRRQAIYLSALKTIPEIKIHFGNFLTKTIWRPVVNLPIAGIVIQAPTSCILPQGQHRLAFEAPEVLAVGHYPPRGPKRKKQGLSPSIQNAVKAEVHTKEEKGSDVNLACHLIDDAWRNRYDAAVVISNDTDLCTPIRMVTQERDKTVNLICPGRYTAHPKLVQVSSFSKHAHTADIRAAQLPDLIPGTTIRKPAGW